MNNTHYVCRLLKPKAQCVVTLLKMGDKIPETCRVIKTCNKNIKTNKYYQVGL
jgi:hypothetical protein